MEEPYEIDKTVLDSDVDLAVQRLHPILQTGQVWNLTTTTTAIRNLWILASGLAKQGPKSPTSWIDLAKRITVSENLAGGAILRGVLQSGDIPFFEEFIRNFKKETLGDFSDLIGLVTVEELHSEGKITTAMKERFVNLGRGRSWA